MFGIRATIVSVALVLPALCGASTAKRAEPMVVGYVFTRNAVLVPGEIDAKSLTRVNYAFANIKDGRMVTGFAGDAQNFAYLTALRRENPSITVLVSVGGWLWSTNFSDISLTKQSREIFIQSVMEFLVKYDLDGLDIDWEYPGMSGAGIRSAPKTSITSHYCSKSFANDSTMRRGMAIEDSISQLPPGLRMSFLHTPRWPRCRSMSIP